MVTIRMYQKYNGELLQGFIFESWDSAIKILSEFHLEYYDLKVNAGDIFAG